MFTEVNLLASLRHCDSEILDTCLSTTLVQSKGKVISSDELRVKRNNCCLNV